MSSSRIIKAEDQLDNVSPGLDLRDFSSLSSLAALSDSPILLQTGSFVPFDNSFSRPEGADSFGVGADSSCESGAAAAAESSVTLSNEEFDAQLRESYSRGLDEGRMHAEKGLQHVFNALRHAVESVQASRDKILHESEDELLKLVISVARRVIHQEVAQDQSIVSGIIKSALSGLSERDSITVRLNADDYEMLASGRQELFSKELQLEKLRFQPDSKLVRGDCQVDTEVGMVDATLEAQIQEIYRRMMEERSSESSAGTL